MSRGKGGDFLKIRLIEPKPPGVNVYDLAKLPRLGLPLIGTMLRQRGHDVRIYCEMLEEVDWRDVEGSDLVGISTTTSTTPRGYAQADRLEKLGIPVVMGGAHVTFLSEEALAHCSYVVRGEGHATMLELVEALEGQGTLADIRGLSFRSEAGIVHNPDRPACSNREFQELPVPDLSLLVGREKMVIRPVMTQWGCPYNCDFCSVIPMFGRRVKARTVVQVVDELADHPTEFVFFCDDNFIANKARTRELLRAVRERGIRMQWSAQIRAAAVFKNQKTREIDTELLELMRDTGCVMVYVGFESVNPATLEEYHKQQDVGQIKESIRILHGYGIKIHGMFVFGAEHDTVQTLRDTVRFALKNKIDTVQFMMLQPLPGTPLFARAEEEGRILSRDWSLYDGHHALVRTAGMAPYTLQLETFRAMARFYSRWQFAKLLAGGMWRSLPHLLRLLSGELLLHRRFRRALAHWLSQGGDFLAVLQAGLRPEQWARLQSYFWIALLRRYGRLQVRRWEAQRSTRRHLEFLEQLPEHN